MDETATPRGLNHNILYALSEIEDAFLAEPDPETKDNDAMALLYAIGKVINAAEWAIAHEIGRAISGFERTTAGDLVEIGVLSGFFDRALYDLIRNDDDLDEASIDFEQLGRKFLEEIKANKPSLEPSQKRLALMELFKRINATARNPIFTQLTDALFAANLGLDHGILKRDINPKIRPPNDGMRVLRSRLYVVVGIEILVRAKKVNSKNIAYQELAKGAALDPEAIRKWDIGVRKHYGDKEVSHLISRMFMILDNPKMRANLLEQFSLDRLALYVRSST